MFRGLALLAVLVAGTLAKQPNVVLLLADDLGEFNLIFFFTFLIMIIFGFEKCHCSNTSF